MGLGLPACGCAVPCGPDVGEGPAARSEDGRRSRDVAVLRGHRRRLARADGQAEVTGGIGGLTKDPGTESAFRRSTGAE
jgi:hypothetical protein